MMEFDSADLAIIDADGTLEDVILHELFHVLGFVETEVVGRGGASPYFTGAKANSAWTKAGGSGNLPIEGNAEPSGTRDYHWDDLALDAELMTGYVNAAGQNPLSAITAQSFADVGYEVQPSFKPDAYVVARRRRLRGSAEGNDDGDEPHTLRRKYGHDVITDRRNYNATLVVHHDPAPGYFGL